MLPTYGFPGDARARRCISHRLPGQVRLKKLKAQQRGMRTGHNKVCQAMGCGTAASFGDPRTREKLFCAQHKPASHVDVKNRVCIASMCHRQPTHGLPDVRGRGGAVRALVCAAHTDSVELVRIAEQFGSVREAEKVGALERDRRGEMRWVGCPGAGAWAGEASVKGNGEDWGGCCQDGLGMGRGQVMEGSALGREPEGRAFVRAPAPVARGVATLTSSWIHDQALWQQLKEAAAWDDKVSSFFSMCVCVSLFLSSFSLSLLSLARRGSN